MKIVIVGGSALSTPSLYDYFSTIQNLPELKTVLIGRDEVMLKAVARASRILIGNTPVDIEYSTIDKLAGAIKNTNIILLQIRVGGFSGRSFDESFPTKYKVCGDEALGPGGLSAAWRAWPEIRKILEIIKVNAPLAIIVFLSSPVSILTRAALLSYEELHIIGICELPWTTLQNICAYLNYNPREVDFSYFGVNHMGWFFQLQYASVDLIRKYVEYIRMRKIDETFPSAELIETCSGIPTKQLHLHYCSSEILKKQRSQSVTRGEILNNIKTSALTGFNEGGKEKVKAILNNRPAPWYYHAVGPFILALAGCNICIPFFLSIRNSGFYQSLRSSDIIEVAHIIDCGKIVPLAIEKAVPPHVAELIEQIALYEELAARAVISRDPRFIEKALEIHPWTSNSLEIPRIAMDIVRNFEQQ